MKFASNVIVDIYEWRRAQSYKTFRRLFRRL